MKKEKGHAQRIIISIYNSAIDWSIWISARKERTNSFFIGQTLNKGPININEEWAVIGGWKETKKRNRKKTEMSNKFIIPSTQQKGEGE